MNKCKCTMAISLTGDGCRYCQPQEYIDQLTSYLEEERTEVFQLSMKLTACGVVALANTPESAAKARDMHPDYMSASCQDVMGAVDREMMLRAELALLTVQQLSAGPLDREGGHAQKSFWAGFETARMDLSHSNIRTAWNEFKSSEQFARIARGEQ